MARACKKVKSGERRPMQVSVSHTLILGGARSGKSRHAQALAEASGHALLYLATAAAGDGEMRERIAQHKAERGPRWRTIEEPLALAPTLLRAAQPHQIILVDCLTLWLSNLMLAGRDIAIETAALAAALPQLRGNVLFVSNEVGSGIVPDNRLARDFRDAQGRLNQSMAAACGHVSLIVAGLPLVLKAGR